MFNVPPSVVLYWLAWLMYRFFFYLLYYDIESTRNFVYYFQFKISNYKGKK